MAKAQKIIDIHSHMGDIFATNRNVTFKQNVKVDESKFYRNPFEALSLSNFSEPLLDPTKSEELENLVNCSLAVTGANTLQRLTERCDKYNLTYVCLMPILPWMSFEEYLAAKSLEPRILPFTSADWTLEPDEIGKKLLKDVKDGAVGLKIHPVIQPISLQDPKVKYVLETYWQKTGLPVLTHCGANSYYNAAEQKATEIPDNGDPKYFVQAVKDMPNVKWIAGHAGGLTGYELDFLKAELGSNCGIYADTTFRSAADIVKMTEVFGEDYCCFGTDTPFSRTDSSLKAVYDAFGEGSDTTDKILYRNAATAIKLQG
jgi:hypothetical protein